MARRARVDGGQPSVWPFATDGHSPARVRFVRFLRRLFDFHHNPDKRIGGDFLPAVVRSDRCPKQPPSSPVAEQRLEVLRTAQVCRQGQRTKQRTRLVSDDATPMQGDLLCQPTLIDDLAAILSATHGGTQMPLETESRLPFQDTSGMSEQTVAPKPPVGSDFNGRSTSAAG